MLWKWMRYGIVAGFSLLLSCSTVSSWIITDEDEAELGAEFHSQLMAKPDSFPVFDAGTDSARMAFKSYVEGVFQSVLQSVPSDEFPDYDFTFTIIDQDIRNAFAVPGGYIYIYTGIIKSMRDEAELAGVLGHEIAHVTQHHYRRSAAKGAAVSTIVQTIAGDDAGALTELVAGIFLNLAGGYISRDHEEESDEYGTKYLHLSQRNSLGIATYFSRQEDDAMPEAFSSHPHSSERVEAVTELVNEEDYTDWNSDATYKYEDRFVANTAVLQ